MHHFSMYIMFNPSANLIHCRHKIMEDKTMKLARFTNSMSPSFPSLFDRFFEGDWMDRTHSNYSTTDTTLPAVNVKS